VPTERLLSLLIAPKLPFRLREEFRTPTGVRKSPKNEPAGRMGELWRFEDFAGYGTCVFGGAMLTGMT
jgi:hypothetical protein